MMARAAAVGEADIVGSTLGVDRGFLRRFGRGWRRGRRGRESGTSPPGSVSAWSAGVGRRATPSCRRRRAARRSVIESSSPTTIAWSVDGEVMIDLGGVASATRLPVPSARAAQLAWSRLGTDLIHVGDVVGVGPVRPDIEPADGAGIDDDRRGSRHDHDVGRHPASRPRCPTHPGRSWSRSGRRARRRTGPTIRRRSPRRRSGDGPELGDRRAGATIPARRADDRPLPARSRPTSAPRGRAAARGSSRDGSECDAIRLVRRGGRETRRATREMVVQPGVSVSDSGASSRSAACDRARSCGLAQ